MKMRLTCTLVFMQSVGGTKTLRLVQTTLSEGVYRTLREVLKRQHLNLEEGLRLEVARFLQEGIKPDASDAFLSRKPVGRSGRKNLSKAHDKYLYEKGRTDPFKTFEKISRKGRSLSKINPYAYETELGERSP